ncbi:MAG: UDP-N-acetylmuramoyl-L-alanyl-D-glutamate--2,6-diaminopimelate ligase, partial [Bdellovibrionales bacterium]|nr:UDP-N-acetylmuramoyl-L-alanyl-D-glutamate--2,6-diaminopimelate ligase [Bdellovibrionales bacterium]
MKLAQLLSIFSQLKWGEYSLNEVVSICRDSRLVVPGSVYVAIRGQQLDGHKFIAEACQAGAIGLILESESNLPSNYRGAVVLVNNTRVALNKLAGRYYGNPAENLFCVGVTGTNGKTTTAYLTE